MLLNMIAQASSILSWWQSGSFCFSVATIIVIIVILGGYQKIRRYHQAKLKQLFRSEKIIEAQEAERKRIASDLHDSLGQNLILLNRKLQRIKSITELDAVTFTTIKSDLQDAIHQLREISYNLHPHILEQLGLTKALESMFQHIIQASQITIQFKNNARLDSLFPIKKQIYLYRIIQEAVNNILKHSHASTVTIEFSQKKKYVYLTIIDDGIGFNVKDSECKGVGLTGIMERSRLLNSKIRILSQRNHGTRIELKLPIGK